MSVRTLGSRVVDLLHPISLGKDVSDELIKDHHRRLARDILGRLKPRSRINCEGKEYVYE